MVSKNVGPPEERILEEAPKIMRRPLPQILDEREAVIRAAVML